MELLSERLPWFAAGPAIGLLVIGLFAVANRPLGASGGFIDLVAFLRRPATGIQWTVYFLAGIVLGGALFGWLAGGGAGISSYGLFDERARVTFWGRALLLGLAGTVMGFGIRTAGGCTSGHGICGTALGSRASWASTICFMTAAIVVAHLFDWVLKARA